MLPYRCGFEDNIAVCPYRKSGLNKMNCPIWNTGIFKINGDVSEKIIVDIFSNTNLEIYKYYTDDVSKQKIKSSLKHIDAENFWNMLVELYQDCQMFQSYFESFAVICNPNSSVSDKVMSVIKTVYDSSKNGNVSDYTPQKAIIEIGFNEIAKQAKYAIHATQFYKNSNNKVFIDFMIEVVADKTLDALKEKLGY